MVSFRTTFHIKKACTNTLYRTHDIDIYKHVIQPKRTKNASMELNKTLFEKQKVPLKNRRVSFLQFTDTVDYHPNVMMNTVPETNDLHLPNIASPTTNNTETKNTTLPVTNNNTSVGAQKWAKLRRKTEILGKLAKLTNQKPTSTSVPEELLEMAGSKAPTGL